MRQSEPRPGATRGPDNSTTSPSRSTLFADGRLTRLDGQMGSSTPRLSADPLRSRSTARCLSSCRLLRKPSTWRRRTTRRQRRKIEDQAIAAFPRRFSSRATAATRRAATRRAEGAATRLLVRTFHLPRLSPSLDVRLRARRSAARRRPASRRPGLQDETGRVEKGLSDRRRAREKALGRRCRISAIGISSRRPRPSRTARTSPTTALTLMSRGSPPRRPLPRLLPRRPRLDRARNPLRRQRTPPPSRPRIPARPLRRPAPLPNHPFPPRLSSSTSSLFGQQLRRWPSRSRKVRSQDPARPSPPLLRVTSGSVQQVRRPPTRKRRSRRPKNVAQPDRAPTTAGRSSIRST